ncbi:MAG: hypothetical protein LCH92_08355 [Proteobacteria bacterium]|nr:hypothetical protein [Pseudomonadota bacterium]
MRKERIERLLEELAYEVTRGVMEREIEPDIHFHKLFPCVGRGDDMAQLEFHVWPASKSTAPARWDGKAKLRLIESDKTARKETPHDR